MRKAHKFLLKSFVFILALSFTVLTFIGCKNNDDNSTDNSSNVSTIQPIFGDDNKNNNADYVTDENQNKPLFEIKSI